MCQDQFFHCVKIILGDPGVFPECSVGYSGAAHYNIRPQPFNIGTGAACGNRLACWPVDFYFCNPISRPGQLILKILQHTLVGLYKFFWIRFVFQPFVYYLHTLLQGVNLFHFNHKTESVQELGPQLAFIRIHGAHQQKPGRMYVRQAKTFAKDP